MDKEVLMKCPLCGVDLIWQSTAMASDVSDAYEGDDTAMVNWYICNGCGRDYEIFDPSETERNTRFKEYWNNY